MITEISFDAFLFIEPGCFDFYGHQKILDDNGDIFSQEKFNIACVPDALERLENIPNWIKVLNSKLDKMENLYETKYTGTKESFNYFVKINSREIRAVPYKYIFKNGVIVKSTKGTSFNVDLGGDHSKLDDNGKVIVDHVYVKEIKNHASIIQELIIAHTEFLESKRIFKTTKSELSITEEQCEKALEEMVIAKAKEETDNIQELRIKIQTLNDALELHKNNFTPHEKQLNECEINLQEMIKKEQETQKIMQTKIVTDNSDTELKKVNADEQF